MMEDLLHRIALARRRLQAAERKLHVHHREHDLLYPGLAACPTCRSLMNLAWGHALDLAEWRSRILAVEIALEAMPEPR